MPEMSPLKIPKPVQFLVELFFFGNLFIAVCAASLVQLTYLQLGLHPHIDGATVLVFGSTLCIYALHRLLIIRQTADDEKNMIRAWARRNAFFLLMFLLAGAGLASLAVFHLRLLSVVLLVCLGVLSLMYEFPIVPYKGRFLKIRHIWVFKPVWLLLVWVVSTSVVPALEQQVPMLDGRVALLVLERSILILFLVLSFDLRDLEYDRREGVKTLAVLFGEKKVFAYYRALLALAVLIALVHYLVLSRQTDLLTARLLNLLLTYYIVSNKRWPRSELYYALLVDGCMLFQFLLTWLMTSLF